MRWKINLGEETVLNTTRSDSRKIVLFSGPSAVGKSTVATALITRHGFTKIATSAYLRPLALERGLDTAKATLQQLGDGLDVQTGFAWVLDRVARPALDANPLLMRWLFDSVRKPEQAALFQDAFPAQVLHVHLDGDEAYLRKNYEYRLANDPAHAGDTPYEQVIAHSNEIASRSLGGIANMCIDVTLQSTEEVAKDISTRADAL